MLNVNDITRIYLGVQGENEARTITIDVSPWLVAYPDGSVTIWHKRNGDSVPSPTGAEFDSDAGTICWTPTNVDTYVDGEGEAEIRLSVGTVIKKSRSVVTGVSPSVTMAGTPLGSDWQSYIDAVDQIRAGAVEAQEAAEDAQEAAEDAQEAAEAAQTAAETAQGLAETAQGLAEGAQAAAETAQGKAETAQEKAETAQSAAEAASNLANLWANNGDPSGTQPSETNNAKYYRTVAQSYSSMALNYKNSANSSANSAATAKTNAEAAAASAVSAKNDAVAAKLAAETAQGKAEDAQAAAETAQGKAEDAQTAAETAQTAAETAQGLAETAQTAAETAQGKAEDAQTAAETAQGKAEDAQTAAETAQTAAETAQGKAEDAQEAAETAQGKAEDAQAAAEEAAETASGKAPAIYEEATGAIASIQDGAENMPVKKLVVGIEPVQDLHGQDSPYPAGGGKNKLPFDLVTMKSINLGGTWTDNVYLRDGITITVNADGTIKASGQAEANVYFTIYEAQFVADAVSGTYILNGCPSGGGGSTYNMDIEGCSGADGGSGVTLTYSGTLTKTKTRIRIISGANLGTGIVFKPMIRLATETDDTFATYENVCPISGWTEADVSRTGVNVWDETWEGGSISPTTGQNANDSTRIRTKGYISVVPNTAYYCKASKDLAIRYYDRNKSFIGTGSAHDSTVTTPANCYYMRFAVVETSTYGNDISINYPSTDTQYHAYSGETIEYEFPEAAGTVYSGTLTIHQDGSGELVVDREIVDLGLLHWTYANDRFTAAGADNPSIANAKQYENTSVANAICSSYKVVSRSSIANGQLSLHYSGQNYINVMDSGYSDAQTFKTGVTGQTLVYELATPIVYELTNQQVLSVLKGTNVCFADCGSVSLEYPADTKLYIDGKVAELQALILENISNS